MKKTVLFLFLSLVMIGCKQGNENRTGNPDQATATPAADDDKCGDNLIVIDSTKTDSLWKAENEQYFCDLELTGRKENHDHKYFIVDLHKVSYFSKDVIGRWLQKNAKKICYEESYEYIQGGHEIEITGDLSAQLGRFQKRELTFGQIKSKIDKFNTRDYDMYVQFSLQPNDPKNPVKIDTFPEFDYTKNLYSIPLLKGIAYNDPTINDTTVFEFYDADVHQDKQLVVFGIKGNNGLLTAFYDITTNPFHKAFLNQ